MLHCSVLRTLMRRIEARTLRSSHVCTCLSLSGIDLSTAALSRADGTIVLSDVLSDVHRVAKLGRGTDTWRARITERQTIIKPLLKEPESFCEALERLSRTARFACRARRAW